MISNRIVLYFSESEMHSNRVLVNDNSDLSATLNNDIYVMTFTFRLLIDYFLL